MIVAARVSADSAGSSMLTPKYQVTSSMQSVTRGLLSADRADRAP